MMYMKALVCVTLLAFGQAAQFTADTYKERKAGHCISVTKDMCKQIAEERGVKIRTNLKNKFNPRGCFIHNGNKPADMHYNTADEFQDCTGRKTCVCEPEVQKSSDVVAQTHVEMALIADMIPLGSEDINANVPLVPIWELFADEATDVTEDQLNAINTEVVQSFGDDAKGQDGEMLEAYQQTLQDLDKLRSPSEAELVASAPTVRGAVGNFENHDVVDEESHPKVEMAMKRLMSTYGMSHPYSHVSDMGESAVKWAALQLKDKKWEAVRDIEWDVVLREGMQAAVEALAVPGGSQKAAVLASQLAAKDSLHRITVVSDQRMNKKKEAHKKPVYLQALDSAKMAVKKTVRLTGKKGIDLNDVDWFSAWKVAREEATLALKRGEDPDAAAMKVVQKYGKKGALKSLLAFKMQAQNKAEKVKNAPQCDLSLHSQAVRMATGVYKFHGDMEGAVDSMPKFMRWNKNSNQQCGWKQMFWECVPPCKKDNHNQFAVYYNEAGNDGGVAEGTCAIAFAGHDEKNHAWCKDTIEKEHEIWKENNGMWDPEKSMMMRSAVMDSGVYVTTMDRTFQELDAIRAGSTYSKWMEMVAPGGMCKRVIVLGHSGGGNIAQLYRVEYGRGADSVQELDNTCHGRPCQIVTFGSAPIFFKSSYGETPTIAGHCNNENVMIYDEHDSAPSGIHCPFGPNLEKFEDMFQQDVIASANHLKGVKRLKLQTKLGLVQHQEDGGCDATTFEKETWAKKPLEMETCGPDENCKTGLALSEVPWRAQRYYVYQTDAWKMGLPGFFSNPQALMYFASGLPKSKKLSYHPSVTADEDPFHQAVANSLELLNEAGLTAKNFTQMHSQRQNDKYIESMEDKLVVSEVDKKVLDGLTLLLRQVNPGMAKRHIIPTTAR